MSNLSFLTQKQRDFIQNVGLSAQKLQKTHSILPSLTIAQAILESNWGKSAIGTNLFGIKAGSSWKGKVQLVWTTEYENGVRIKIQANFRDYDSLDDSIADHAKLLKLKRYTKVREAKDYKTACVEIQKAGYATDPNYAVKLISLIENYRLFDYDKEEEKIRMKDWRDAQGEEAIKKLVELGIINDAEKWLGMDLVEGKIEPWLFFTLIERLSQSK